MDAGREFGIKPFGLEAQRVLRLEKGHIIIGQDTDAMTFPHEVDMAWAIAKKKPFFVGGRSIEQRLRQPMKRKLVGFTIEDAGVAAGGPAPDESNVVLRGGAVAGFVTSVARSPALGRVIGLAYAHPDDAELGKTIQIKLDSGQIVDATVASPHFYDPDNARQEM
jgi:sarcosine oxidase subunit alpha